MPFSLRPFTCYVELTLWLVLRVCEVLGLVFVEPLLPDEPKFSSSSFESGFLRVAGIISTLISLLFL